MPKGKGGKGGKNRRRGKGDADGAKRELTLKEDGQEYAQVKLHSKRVGKICNYTRNERGR